MAGRFKFGYGFPGMDQIATARNDKRANEYRQENFYDEHIAPVFDWLTGNKKEAPTPPPRQQQQPSKPLSWYRKNLDPSDTEMVKELQQKLGVEADGMFGPQTQKAWRAAVADNIDFHNKINEHRGKYNEGQAAKRDLLKKTPFLGGLPDESYEKAFPDRELSDLGGDQYKYDYNPEMLDQRVSDSGPIKGLLQKGWYGLDKAVGGWLPGGYKKGEKGTMTAEDYEDQYGYKEGID